MTASPELASRVQTPICARHLHNESSVERHVHSLLHPFMIFETFFQDLRIGLRVLIKEKGFCALAVFVLALGIAAVTTQYAVVNGVLLHAFTFRDSERLVDVQMVDPSNFKPDNFNSRMTIADFVELRERQQSFENFVGYLNLLTLNLTYDGKVKRLDGGYVTYDFFRALGVSPALGRDFLPEDDRQGVEKAVLISDSLWRSEFGADRNVIGRTVRINGTPGQIIGVMPPRFNFPTSQQVWVPLHAELPMKPRNDRGINSVAIIGRLKPNVSMEQAQAEVSVIAKQFADAHPDTNKQFTLGYVRPLIAAFTGGQLSGLLYTMLGFCVGVLLIACVNVMNMQFARATLRAKELAVRSSLGATRSRLIRQMLTESLILASLGAIIGVALAFWSTDYLNSVVRNMQNPIPSWMSFDIDGQVLGFIVGATMLSAIISGFVPAWISSRANAADALKESGRGNTGRSIGAITRGLVVFQIVITSVLLIGALLQAQSIVKQQTIDYGYDTASILTARFGLLEGDYPTSEKRRLFYDALLRELRATSQFESAALTDRRQMVLGRSGPVEIEGREYMADVDRVITQVENITPGYFETLNARVLEGRDFADTDSDQRQPVAIVNATFARRHFGQESALGRRFRTTAPNGTTPGPWRIIIGVVSNIRMQGPFNNQSDGSGFYIPFFATAFGPLAPEPVAHQLGTIIARPRGGQRADTLEAVLRTTVNKVDPNLPLYFVGAAAKQIEGFLTQNRLVASMFAIFGAIAVVLAAVGLYGVMSFSVNQRTQEFGIRMALGAGNGEILKIILRQGAWQIGIGLGLGLGLAFLIAMFGRNGISNFLFQISPRDPVTYAAVALLLAVVSIVATLIPARRATKVDPMVALRAE
jgi:putative ABC transport system permease protein